MIVVTKETFCFNISLKAFFIVQQFDLKEFYEPVVEGETSGNQDTNRQMAA